MGILIWKNDSKKQSRTQLLVVRKPSSMGKQVKPQTVVIAFALEHPKAILTALDPQRSKATGSQIPILPTTYPAANGNAVGANQ
jgi:hypothetical protein